MDGNDFLQIAEELAERDDEAAVRSSVSRAYYGAFHVAMSLVNAAGIRLSKHAAAHSELCRCLRHCGNDDFGEIAGRLESLRTIRNNADYELPDSRFGKKRTAAVNVAIAREIADVLANCRSSEAFEDAKNGLRIYASKVKLTVV